MNVCILGITFDTGNMGVSALAEGIVQSILKYFPNADITFLNYGFNNGEIDFDYNGKQIRITKANMRFSKKIYLNNNIARLMLLALLVRLIPIKKYKERLVNRNYYLSVINKADIVASIAGGDSFSDIYGMGRFYYVTLPQILCIILGKEIIQLPQTYGPFNKTITKIITKFILKNSCAIYSRDHQGVLHVKELLKNNNNVESKVMFSYDVGFIVEPMNTNKADRDCFNTMSSEKPLVGLNVSGLLYMGGYSRQNMFKFIVEYKELIKILIETIIEKWKANAILVPHVFGEPQQNPESDQAICGQLYESYRGIYTKKIFYPKGKYDHREIKYIIGKCDFFLGSRMHACIAAISQNIPTVPIAYSKKFIGVMDTVGMNPYIADPRVMKIDKILQVIETAWKKKEEIREKLEIIIPQVKEDVCKIFAKKTSEPNFIQNITRN